MKAFGAATITIVLLLTGCANSTPESPQPSSTATPSPTPTASVSGEAAFVEQFRAQNPDAARATDAQWLAVGDSVCEALEAGASPNQVVDSMQGSNVSAAEAASAIVLAATTLCPEFAR